MLGGDCESAADAQQQVLPPSLALYQPYRCQQYQRNAQNMTAFHHRAPAVYQHRRMQGKQSGRQKRYRTTDCDAGYDKEQRHSERQLQCRGQPCLA